MHTTQKEQTIIALDLMRQRITEKIELNQEELFWYQHDCGMQYLKIVTAEDDHAYNVLKESRIFWNWWKNQWLNRDEYFLNDISRMKLSMSPQAVTAHYRNFHNPVSLAREKTPHASLLEESYAEMIGKIHDSL